MLPKGGCDAQGLIYDDKKTTYRTEVDQALRSKPDLIFAAGYTPDTIVLLKDIYRAGFKGKVIGFGLLDQPEAGRPDRPARGGRGHLHLLAVAGRGQRGL